MRHRQRPEAVNAGRSWTAVAQEIGITIGSLGIGGEELLKFRPVGSITVIHASCFSLAHAA
ncbi:hypothetical protein [Micromonospora musae]|uniref:hypothetical protein n=1 Tax=Micromonospora musae TaxID=1894970 RepID=UPI0034364749